MFDELVRLKFGNVAAYQRVRQGAWNWLMEYPMKDNVWVGYFEDVTPSMANMNNVIPLETARYLILNPQTDPNWQRDAAGLIRWVKTTPKWSKFTVHGALITTEQGNGETYCCQPPGWCCDSHTACLGGVEALYFAKTGDVTYKEDAFRSLNWVTYFQGFPPKGRSPWGDGQWWFTDEFADGPRRMMDALWAVPSWAPAWESHFLGTTSVVTHISYGKGRVTYSTFDAHAVDVLRLNLTPTSVTADGRPLEQRSDLTQKGYTFDPSTDVLRVQHDNSRRIDIEGDGGSTPPEIVDFDNPALPANTILVGQYPTGEINWGEARQWKIGVPQGRLATFNLVVANPKLTKAGFYFYYPRVFAGMVVYNRSAHDVTLKVHSPDQIDFVTTIPAEQVRQIRTHWVFRSPSVSFEVEGNATLGDLCFDNLAYTESEPMPPGVADPALSSMP